MTDHPENGYEKGMWYFPNAERYAWPMENKYIREKGDDVIQAQVDEQTREIRLAGRLGAPAIWTDAFRFAKALINFTR